MLIVRKTRRHHASGLGVVHIIYLLSSCPEVSQSKSQRCPKGVRRLGEFDHDKSPPFPPPEAMIHPSPMLRVNQKLRGVLMSTDGTSMIA